MSIQSAVSSVFCVLLRQSLKWVREKVRFRFANVYLGDQSAFDFFRQESSHADIVIRTEAMSNLVLVCALMTPEKVRADMIPYLLSM